MDHDERRWLKNKETGQPWTSFIGRDCAGNPIEYGILIGHHPTPDEIMIGGHHSVSSR